MIYRIDVRGRDVGATRGGADPIGEAVRQQILELGTDVGRVSTSRIFLIDVDADQLQIRRVATELLADPIVEEAEVTSSTAPLNGDTTGSRIEIHLKPGVMDPVGASTEMAIRDMGIAVREVRTGRAYLLQHKLDRADL